MRTDPVVDGDLRPKMHFVPVSQRVSHENEVQQSTSSRARPSFNIDADHADMMQLIAGHEEAMESLMHRHARALYSQLARLLRNRADAYDSLQEAFVRVYLHRDSFDPQRKFSSWLYVIAFNLARDRLRRRARQPEFVSLEDPEQGRELKRQLLDRQWAPDEELENQERFRSLGEALGTLPDVLRQALIALAFEEKSQPEIASEMHCTAKAIEMRLYRARKLLHARLEKEFGGSQGILGSEA